MRGLFYLVVLILACGCASATDKNLLKGLSQRNAIKKLLFSEEEGLNHDEPKIKKWKKNHNDITDKKISIPTALPKFSKSKKGSKTDEGQHSYANSPVSPKQNKFRTLLYKLMSKTEPFPTKAKHDQKQYNSKPVTKSPSEKNNNDEFQDQNNVFISVPLELFNRFVNPKKIYKPKNETKPKIERPPKTMNEPRKINFDHSTNMDTEGRLDTNFQDKGVKFAAGSYQDKVYSQWYVVTKDGLEYDGDTHELDTIFDLANKQSLPSSSDVIPGNVLYTMGSMQQAAESEQPDSRVLVSNTKQFPYSVIGRLDVGCTGTLIGPNHVLTAGHCVYTFEKKLWFKNLNFRKGKACNPNNGEAYHWKLAITVKGWKDYGYPSYDYAIIVVTKTTPQWMTFGWSNSLHKANTEVVGYPNDKEDVCMWKNNCTISQEWNDLLGYKCDTASGMSGGPVYR